MNSFDEFRTLWLEQTSDIKVKKDLSHLVFFGFVLVCCLSFADMFPSPPNSCKPQRIERENPRLK